MPRLRWLVSVGCVFASILIPLLAGPVTYVDPFHQSPVRADPDDVILITGRNLKGPIGYPTVVYVRDGTPHFTSPWPPIPASSDSETGVAKVLSVSSDRMTLAVRLPSVMLRGHSYSLWVTYNGQYSVPVRINDARPLWFSPSYVYETAPVADLPRVLKVMGRNLDPIPDYDTRLRLTGNSGPYELSAYSGPGSSAALEAHVAKFMLPALSEGSYTVEVSRDGGDGWVTVENRDGAELKLDVLPNPTTQEVQVTCDKDDDSCIKNVIANATAGQTLFFEEGTWELDHPTNSNNGIIVGEGISLKGEGDNDGDGIPDTVFLRTTHWTDLTVLTLKGGNTISGIHFDDAVPSDEYNDDWGNFRFRYRYLQLGERVPSGEAPYSVEDVTITDCHFSNMNIGIGSADLPIERLHITNNDFENVYFRAISLGGRLSGNDAIHFNVTDSLIRRNGFTPSDFGEPGPMPEPYYCAFKEEDQPRTTCYRTENCPDCDCEANVCENSTCSLGGAGCASDVDCSVNYCDLWSGSIATVIGASLRFDFSENEADGTVNGGWRAGHFWHMNNSLESVLISENSVTCAGDKQGDGESFSIDNNRNVPAFDVVVVNATAGTVDSVSAVIDGDEVEWNVDPAIDDDYYDGTNGYWVQIVDGKGLGQVRKITEYEEIGTSDTWEFTVAPDWDVIPDSSSRFSVSRQAWQIYVVDNFVDSRRPICQKDNPTRPGSGAIWYHSNSSDSVIEGNEMLETDGIRLQATFSETSANYSWFDEVRSNVIDGEYDFFCRGGDPLSGFEVDSVSCDTSLPTVPPVCPNTTPSGGPVYPPCLAVLDSRSGVQFDYGFSGAVDAPVLTLGNSVSHNFIRAADGLRGGAIGFHAGNYNAPDSTGTTKLHRSNLIFHNAISELERYECDSTSCHCRSRDSQSTQGFEYLDWGGDDGGTGIQIRHAYPYNGGNPAASYVNDTVLYTNTIERTCYPIDDLGVNTVDAAVPDPHQPNPPEACAAETNCCDADGCLDNVTSTSVVNQQARLCNLPACSSEPEGNCSPDGKNHDLSCPVGETVHTETCQYCVGGRFCTTLCNDVTSVCEEPVGVTLLNCAAISHCEFPWQPTGCAQSDTGLAACVKTDGDILNCPTNTSVWIDACGCSGAPGDVDLHLSCQ